MTTQEIAAEVAKEITIALIGRETEKLSGSHTIEDAAKSAASAYATIFDKVEILIDGPSK